MPRILVALIAVGLSACSSLQGVPSTLGERSSGFTYIPLDPLPVVVQDGPECERDFDAAGRPLVSGLQFKPLLDALPDNAVRIAVKEYDASGELSFGGSSVGIKGSRYQVVLDYINVDATNLPFYINAPIVKS